MASANFIGGNCSGFADSCKTGNLCFAAAFINRHRPAGALSDFTLEVGDWLRAGTVATNKSSIAVMAAMLPEDSHAAPLPGCRL